MRPLDDKATGERPGRCDRAGAGGYVDIHCHCLPGLDDGPADLHEALALCRALVDDGVTCAVATPHQLGRYDGTNQPAEVRLAVATLRRALADAEVRLEVLPGADVRVDERLAAMLQADRVLTLGDTGKYLLIELPGETFIDLSPLVVHLAEAGVTTIVSHPERHAVLAARPGAVADWLAAGAALQITAGSLVGEFGTQAERAAWFYVSSGAASLVASDAHNLRRRPPRMSAAFQAISQRLGQAAARPLCAENPSRVVRGQPLRRVPQLAGGPQVR